MATARETPVGSHLRTLISACHILHFHNILDAYGHISVRHPSKPDVFVMPRNIAPGTISLESDLVEYHVSDASPVKTQSPAGYAERYIHSEIYKKHVSVQSVIHSHCAAVTPYTISSVPLRPCFHMAGFLGSSTPVYDISKYYAKDDTRNLLVNSVSLGAALASYFSTSTSNGAEHQVEHTNSVVLMRGHGFTVVGSSIEESVLRAIYTAENATIQTTSLITNSAYFDGSSEAGRLQYLRPEELGPTTEMTKWSSMRPWNLWLREVELQGLYVNNAT